MGVYGVSVEKVKLHLTNDRAERGKVAAHHPMTRHSAQLFGHVVWYAQNLHEEVAVDLARTKCVVD